jgi:hypothetical protein
MFEASVDGQPYDPDRWAAYYKPSGFQGGTSNESAPRAAAPAPAAPAAQHDDPPFEPDEDTPVASAPVAAPAAAKPSSQKAEDILAMIRNRQK